MKRTICILLICLFLLLPVPAMQEGSARFYASVYAAQYGGEAVLNAACDRDGREYAIRTEDGRELARTKPGGDGSRLEFRFTVSRDLPHRSVIGLYHADGTEKLCEAILFADEPQNQGIRRVETKEKKIALTFDAAINDSFTVRIMDLLEQYDARATFFVIGQYADAHPELCRELIARGHELASHSYEHLEMSSASVEQSYASLVKADQAIRAVNGDRTILYRPPSGISTFRDRAVSHGLGSEIILWEVDSGDGFKNKTLYEVIMRVKKNLYNGGIVLMHVYGGTTLKALEELLPYYKEQGYEIVKVSDLLLKEDSFIDVTGTQRALKHETELLPSELLAPLNKERATYECLNGHQFENGVCTRCGSTKPEKFRLSNGVSVTAHGTREGLYRAKIRHSGEQRFTIRETDANGNGTLLVSQTGNWSGSVLLYGTPSFALEYGGRGGCSIETEQIGYTRSKQFSGRGASVTDIAQLDGGTYQLTHDGKSNFVVRMLTTDGETVLVSQTGKSDLTVKLGIPDGSLAVFEVLADGNWTITPVK